MKLGRLLDGLDSALDRISFRLGKAQTYLKEASADAIAALFQAIAKISGFTFVSLVNAMIRSPSQQGGLVGKFARRVVGVPLVLLLWLTIQTAISLVTLAANVVGMRRGHEYTFRENFATWLPLIVLALALPWIGVTNYFLGQVVNLLSYSIIVLGLNFAVVAGQISLGHGVFVLLGGYVTIILSTGLLGVHLYLVFALLGAGLFSAMIGCIIGFPASRVKGPYLALLTLGLMISVPTLLKRSFLVPLTGGPDGLSFDTLAPPQALAHVFSKSAWSYLIGLIVFTLMFIAGHIVLRRSKIGRALIAIREGEDKCSVLGINIGLYKMLAFALSAFYAGVGGGLLSLQTGFISPDSLSIKDSIDYMVALVVGGRGSLLGSVVSGFFLNYQTLFASVLAALHKDGDKLLWAIQGGILIFVMLVAPRGVAGEVTHWLTSRKFKLPSRRKHRREPFPDYEIDEELIAAGSVKWDDKPINNGQSLPR